MGLLSSIGKVVFGDPTKDIKKGAKQTAEGLRQGREYLQGIDRLPLQYRDEALKSLFSFFDPSDPSGQQAFIDKAQASPFYQSMLEAGEEGVLRGAAATGGLRTGATNQALANLNQNVLQQLVGQQLQGQQFFATPQLQSGNIAQLYGAEGQAMGQGTVAAGQAEQSLGGNLLGGVLGGIGAAGSLGWKPFG